MAIVVETVVVVVCGVQRGGDESSSLHAPTTSAITIRGMAPVPRFMGSLSGLVLQAANNDDLLGEVDGDDGVVGDGELGNDVSDREATW